MSRLASVWRIVALASLVLCAQAFGAVIGQVDNFEDGTTQGWLVGLLGSPHPAPPVNVSDGGPQGAGDNYLKLTSIGGVGAGNRLVAINLAQWAGNYTAAGITTISMDLLNLGTTDLSIRLYLENPMNAPPTDDAVSQAIFLQAGGGWTHADFGIDAQSLTSLHGNLNTLLSNVTALRIVHTPSAEFPGAPIVGMLGVDNITAAVPEPASAVLLIGGVGALLFLYRRRSVSAR